ncbi:MAG: nuclear transport factor 2 family protein [Pseudomonadota bacterium]
MAWRAGLVASASLVLAACVATGPAAGPGDASDEAEIKALLAEQAEAWNRGDIDSFMDGYARSDALRFASGGAVTRGWSATLARYKARYRDRAAMGTLTFSDLEIVALSDDAAVAHGAWQLARETDRPSGLFTLVLRQSPAGEWQIVSDTTTSAD